MFLALLLCLTWHQLVAKEVPKSSHEIVLTDGARIVRADKKKPDKKKQHETVHHHDHHHYHQHIQERRQLGHKILLGQEGTHREVEQYAKHYHQQLAKRDLMFYLHVSKTAGTFLCAAGAASGCEEESGLGKNCHIDADQPDWLGVLEATRTGRKESCHDLSLELAGRHLTLEGNENYLIAEGLCPQFWNFVVFRHPIARVLSHLSMLNGNQATWKDEPYKASHPPVNPDALFKQLPILTNNYFIRVLLGSKVFGLPFGAITATHLEQAKHVIEGFDVLFVMDEDHPSLLESDLHRTLGWSSSGINATESRVGETDEYRQLLNWNRAQWDALEAANSLDLQLFQHAQALHHLDQQVFQHSAFSKLSAKMPTETCGFFGRKAKSSQS